MRLPKSCQGDTGQACRVKLFNKRDFWRVLFNKMKNLVAFDIFDDGEGILQVILCEGSVLQEEQLWVFALQHGQLGSVLTE